MAQNHNCYVITTSKQRPAPDIPPCNPDPVVIVSNLEQFIQALNSSAHKNKPSKRQRKKTLVKHFEDLIDAYIDDEQ